MANKRKHEVRKAWTCYLCGVKTTAFDLLYIRGRNRLVCKRECEKDPINRGGFAPSVRRMAAG